MCSDVPVKEEVAVLHPSGQRALSKLPRVQSLPEAGEKNAVSHTGAKTEDGAVLQEHDHQQDHAVKAHAKRRLVTSQK